MCAQTQQTSQKEAAMDWKKAVPETAREDEILAALLAAEARVEAAEQAVDSIIDLAQTFIMAGDRAKFLIRVAALACPPQEEST